jgi:5'-nucleotidase
VGSALTLHDAIQVSPVDIDELLGDEVSPQYPITAFSVMGTPADSCVMALERLVGQVDLVVSGINRGSNVGTDIFVSGTVGAALQGYLRGFPTLAVSVGSVQNPQFDGAARLLQLLAAQLGRTPPQEAFFLNINLPSMPLSGINGVQITRLGGRSYGESVREEGIEQPKMYRISRNKPIPGDNPEGTDIWALKNNRISITPLQVDLTNGEQIPQLESLLVDLPAQLLQRQD